MSGGPRAAMVAAWTLGASAALLGQRTYAQPVTVTLAPACPLSGAAGSAAGFAPISVAPPVGAIRAPARVTAAYVGFAPFYIRDARGSGVVPAGCLVVVDATPGPKVEPSVEQAVARLAIAPADGNPARPRFYAEFPLRPDLPVLSGGEIAFAGFRLEPGFVWDPNAQAPPRRLEVRMDVVPLKPAMSLQPYYRAVFDLDPGVQSVELAPVAYPPPANLQGSPLRDSDPPNSVPGLVDGWGVPVPEQPLDLVTMRLEVRILSGLEARTPRPPR